MSRATSRGHASVRMVCEAFGISRQAYYAAQAPTPVRAETRRESPRAGLSTAQLLARIRAVVAIQTLKVELLWTRDWESLEELREAIAQWAVRYNTERPHQSLGWRTPAEQRASNLNGPLERAA